MHGLQACLNKYIIVAAVVAFCMYAQHVKMSLKGEVRGHALNSHGNYIVDLWRIMEKSLNCVRALLE